jgi:hypothetical protein
MKRLRVAKGSGLMCWAAAAGENSCLLVAAAKCTADPGCIWQLLLHGGHPQVLMAAAAACKKPQVLMLLGAAALTCPACSSVRLLLLLLCKDTRPLLLLLSRALQPASAAVALLPCIVLPHTDTAAEFHAFNLRSNLVKVWSNSPLELCWVLAQAEWVKAVVADQGAIQVVRELAAREPAGAVGRGSLHIWFSVSTAMSCIYCGCGDSCRLLA